MLVSHNAKFIFVHVQKTGGISIEAALKQQFQDTALWHGRLGHARNGIEEWGRGRWDEYYSFGFVRNPWDRLVSYYAMIQPHMNSPWRPDLPLVWEQVMRKGRTFADFLDHCTEEVFDEGCWKSFAYNQVDYLNDAGGLVAVNKVGRFESIDEDMEDILASLGVRTTLPHHNASNHTHYSDWYDDRTEEIVRQRFSRDVEAFGYTFERR